MALAAVDHGQSVQMKVYGDRVDNAQTRSAASAKRRVGEGIRVSTWAKYLQKGR